MRASERFDRYAAKTVQASEHPLKLLYADLKRMGIVGSRPHLRDLIRRGTIRPPHKDGDSRQARAWWYWDEIMQDLENERQKFNARVPSPRS